MAKHRGFQIVEGKIDLSKPMVSYYYKGIPVLRRLPDKKNFAPSKRSQEMCVVFGALSHRYSKVLHEKIKDGWEAHFHLRKPDANEIVNAMSLMWPGGVHRQKQVGYYGSPLDLYIASNSIAYKSDMTIPRDIAPSIPVSRPIQPVPQEWGYENGEAIISADIPEQDPFYKEMVARALARFDGGLIYVRDENGKVIKKIRNRIEQQIVAKIPLKKWPTKVEFRFNSVFGCKAYDHKEVPLTKLGTGNITFILDLVGAEGPDVGPLVSKSSDAHSIRINIDTEKEKKISDKFFEELNKGKKPN